MEAMMWVRGLEWRQLCGLGGWNGGNDVGLGIGMDRIMWVRGLEWRQ